MSASDIFQRISDAAPAAGLDLLLVGGHAVNAHGYARTTLDVDFLTRETQRAAWMELLSGWGYRLIHETTAFAQFDPPSREEMELDVMFVNDSTFEKLSAGKQMLPVAGTILPVPSVLHLIALKLHATHSWNRAVEGKDFYDIVNLVRMHQIDVEGVPFKEILNRYATETIRQRILEECSRSK